MKWIRKWTVAKKAAAELPRLARLHGADKWGVHWYARHHETHFRNFRNRPMNVLEIGAGGYADPDCGGASLRMWRDYFTIATIVGIDIHNKMALAGNRVRIFQCSQDDPAFLRWVSEEVGGFTLIIDDGSHISAHIRTSFQICFQCWQKTGFMPSKIYNPLIGRRTAAQMTRKTMRNPQWGSSSAWRMA